MTDLLTGPYFWSAASILGLLLMYPFQLFIGDVAQEKMGRTPGTPTLGGPEDFGFRADRAASNSLENMPFFIFMMLMSVALVTPPTLTNVLAIMALVLRVIHMVAYYAGHRNIRGLSWLAGLLVMLTMSGNMIWTLVAG